MIRYLAGLDRSDLLHRVKAMIIDQLPSGTVSDDSVAETLHMSVRSLQRKLHNLDASFRQLLDETRRELAQSYVSDRSVSLGEAAFLLGYSDSSAFSRAYKRWNGLSPTEARRS
jgi:AraC-like DNA-binding protein